VFKEIKCISFLECETKLAAKDRSVIVSINTPGTKPPRYKFNGDRSLIMFFDNVREPIYLKCKAVKVFDDKMASQLLKFVDRHNKTTVENLVIQSESKYARGPAVAMALSEVFGIKYTADKDVKPNMLVRDKLLEVSKKQKEQVSE